MKIQTYRNLLGKYGKTSRQRAVNNEILDLNKYAIENPSYKEVVINGETHYLSINDGTFPKYKKYYSMPNDTINAGDIIEWSNTRWLVKTRDFDDEIYTRGELEQCNWLLKWQNKKGEIVERWVVVNNATAYNTGLKGENAIKLGYDQLLILIPFDEETRVLDRGKRFFVDNNTGYPTPYELTKPDTVTNVYEGKGYLYCIFSETQYNPNVDNVELGLCDYREIIDPIKQDGVYTSRIVSNTDSIKCGYKKGLTLHGELYYGDTLEELTDFEWEINSTIKDCITTTENGNDLQIVVDGEDCLGSLITVTLKSKTNSFVEDKITLKVINYY